MLTLVTAPDGNIPVVTVARAMERFRIYDSESSIDLAQLIEVATKAVEHSTGLILRRSTWRYYSDCWPLSIPVFPIRNILSIKYLDVNNAEQTILGTDYYWKRTSTGADLFYETSFSSPILSTRSMPIAVEFEAGYAAGGGSDGDLGLILPPTAEMAVLFLVGHWYNMREPVAGEEAYKVPLTFEFLAAQLRTYS